MLYLFLAHVVINSHVLFVGEQANLVEIVETAAFLLDSPNSATEIAESSNNLNYLDHSWPFMKTLDLPSSATARSPTDLLPDFLGGMTSAVFFFT